MRDTSFRILAHGTQSRVVMRQSTLCLNGSSMSTMDPPVHEITTKIGRMIIPLRYLLQSIFGRVNSQLEPILSSEHPIVLAK